MSEQEKDASYALLELAKYKKAVEIARKMGEHYPVCNTPPSEIVGDRVASKVWRDANRGRCTCWKAQMEKALE